MRQADHRLGQGVGVLASAGIDVRMRVSADPSPEAAAVLVPVVREAVTNILKHSSASYCRLEITADARLLQLSISNDGSGDAGSGLRNLAARLEAAGGHETATRGDGTFSLAVELPLVESQPVV
jgi:two-component system, NarL family, sensor histidine kinase DesK